MSHLKKRFWQRLRPHHFILIVASGEAAPTPLVQALLQVKTYLTLIVAGSKDALALDGFLKPDLLVFDDSHRANESGDLSGWLSLTQTFKEVPTIILSSSLAQKKASVEHRGSFTSRKRFNGLNCLRRSSGFCPMHRAQCERASLYWAVLSSLSVCSLVGCFLLCFDRGLHELLTGT